MMKSKMDYSVQFSRIQQYLEQRFPEEIAANKITWELFQKRLDLDFQRLFSLLVELYGKQVDFYYFFQELMALLFSAMLERSPDLQAADNQLLQKPAWFQDHQILAGVCYVDLFAGDLTGIRKAIPYFQELGLTYLHLMPLYDSPEGENDGGFAVSSFRKVKPGLGTMQQLRELADELCKAGIHLCLDLVLNHTSNEHEWAVQARAGNPHYSDYYFLFEDKDVVDAYQENLREIFPQDSRGSFTYLDDIDVWVWTTFHEYQWDLNYSNPAVFNQIADEMFFLINAGVRILRIDAVAFIWKEMGTSCENLPQVHTIIQAYNILSNLLAPGTIFKSEAIVHPDDVGSYIRPEECQISYNPLMMATSWEALATRKVELLEKSLQNHFRIHPRTAWVNYVRVHDDIGWTFSDETAAELGINAFDHRQFLNDFYTGKFPGSFARGLPFQFNPVTRDMRISGSCASLAGLEKALEEETDREVELAIRRILLLHSLPFVIGGIPLIYLGDEIAMLNDYSYREVPDRADDSRWVHRPEFDWERAAQRHKISTIPGKVFSGLKQMIDIRKENELFSVGQTEIVPSGNPHVLALTRKSGHEEMLCVFNFSEMPLDIHFRYIDPGFVGIFTHDLVSGEKCNGQIGLVPYQYAWLLKKV